MSAGAVGGFQTLGDAPPQTYPHRAGARHPEAERSAQNGTRGSGLVLP